MTLHVLIKGYLIHRIPIIIQGN